MLPRNCFICGLFKLPKKMLTNIIEIVILSLIQGISEFLPISSSAHLVVISTLYEFKSSSILIDVSLHLGSLLAIVFFFKKEIFNFKNNQKLLSLMILGSIPLFIVGYIIYETELIFLLRDIKVIAWSTLIFGIILYFADKGKNDKKISSNLNLKVILWIGLIQIIALVPGVSRAGVTITAARFFRFNRFDSSKISFLLAIPALTGASFLGLKDVINQSFELNYLVFVATTLSFLSSYLTVRFFLKFVNKFSLSVFVIYRIIIAIILFLIIYN